jgi:uncharacterized membrane protein YcaP (DUF421 family)
METVFRALAIYGVILIMTRISGRRTLSDVTVFDFVLVLLIAETAQNALIGTDGSLTNTIVLIATLILTDVVLSLAKSRANWLNLIIDGAPTVLIRGGQLEREAMRMSRVSVEDILQCARMQHGLANLSEVSDAVLETSGTISIIPRRDVETGAT